VAFQTSTATAFAQPGRDRAITVEITKIWSDQFPPAVANGVVANYLPGDGTQGSGAGAGLVGNARQLLIMAAGQYRSDGIMYDAAHSYIKANIVTDPATEEALNHVLVRLRDGSPPLEPNRNILPGSGSRTGAEFSLIVAAPVGDYSVVAGVDLQGGGQASGTLTNQQRLFPFTRDCVHTPGYSPCYHGAVRITSQAEYEYYQLAAASGGTINSAFAEFSSGLWPTAGSFLKAFATGNPPAGDAHPPSPSSIRINTSELYFNTGLIFGAPIAGEVNLYAGAASRYTFPANSNVTQRIWNSSDFQELIAETLQAHKADVTHYFSDNPASSSYDSPPWQAIGCWSVPNANCTGLPETTHYPNNGSEVDRPPLFPCATSQGALPTGVQPNMLAFPGVQCDLRLETDPNLKAAFGRVGYNFAIIAHVSRANPNVVSSVSLSGYIYDTYQWNPAEGANDYHLANIQGGFSTLGVGGHLYKTQVQVDTTDTGFLFLANETQYSYTFY